MKNDIHSVNAYKNVYEQYVEDASFLWLLRSIAIEQPHYNIEEIQELERRIEAPLDGLITSIDIGWEVCLQALELVEPGEVFTATVIAFRSHEREKIQKAIEVGISNDAAFTGLVSAMGWLPANLIQPWIKKFLGSKDLNHKYLAISSCSVRRENPGEYLNQILEREDCKQHEKLYARSLRLVGELRRQDCMPYIVEAMESDSDDIHFWSNWSAVLLGDHAAVTRIERHVFSLNSHQMNAINIAFRVLTVEQARNWISKLVNDPEQTRTVIKATGILGDPHAVNWLIQQMRQTSLARLAAEAFTMITGIDLEQRQLEAEAPPNIPLHPNNDSSDDDVSLDEDENLLWPDVEKVSAMWMNEGRNFISGQRYFMGQQINAELLKTKLTKVNQRQRHAVAMELALTSSEVPLQNTRARVKS